MNFMTDTANTRVADAYAKCRDGDIQGAMADYAAASSLYELAGNAAGQAHCLRHLGDILREAGRGTEAELVLRAAEALYRTLDDPLGLANTLRPLALLHGDSALAFELWREARDLYRKVGVDAGVAEAERHLGDR